MCQVTDSSVMRSKQIFFTLSPDGLTQFSLDSTGFIDLARWLKEAALHEKISKIRTFEKFRKWKSFKCWRNALSRHKFQSAKQVRAESLYPAFLFLIPTYYRSFKRNTSSIVQI